MLQEKHAFNILAIENNKKEKNTCIVNTTAPSIVTIITIIEQRSEWCRVAWSTFAMEIHLFDASSHPYIPLIIQKWFST